jgi:hypothetical protein
MVTRRAVLTLPGAHWLAQAGGARADAPPVARSGALRGLEGHGARGRVTLTVDGRRAILRFSPDFRITGTNRVLAGLGRGGRPDRRTLVTLLPELSGAIEVTLPEQVDSAAFTEVWLWCDQHASDAAAANLR